MGTLKAGETFSMAYRLLIRNQPTYVNLKISRLDENSISRVVVGVSSIDAGTDLQKKDAPFAGISRALAGDYVRIYYLDMQTDGFILFDTRNSGNALQVEKTGDDLFQLIRETAKETMHPDDLEGFLNQFTRENLYEYHAGMRPLQLTYRLYMNGRWNYLKLKSAAPESPDDTHIIIGITNVDEQYRLEQEQKEALRIAKQDSLTGLQNKRAFSEASKVIDDAIRSQSAEPFALVICDMNNLKQINDTLGHSEGDEAIRQAGRTISHIYPNSTVYRIGGDEFAVILRSTDYENREHACKMLQSLNHAHPVGRQIIIAAGMTDYDPARDHSFSQIVNRADAAMYENKRELKK